MDFHDVIGIIYDIVVKYWYYGGYILTSSVNIVSKHNINVKYIIIMVDFWDFKCILVVMDWNIIFLLHILLLFLEYSYKLWLREISTIIICCF